MQGTRHTLNKNIHKIYIPLKQSAAPGASSAPCATLPNLRVLLRARWWRPRYLVRFVLHETSTTCHMGRGVKKFMVKVSFVFGSWGLGGEGNIRTELECGRLYLFLLSLKLDGVSLESSLFLDDLGLEVKVRVSRREI